MHRVETIRFVAEGPLGKLVKWLRLIGFDTLYEPHIPKGIRNIASAERIRLTRTKNSLVFTSVQPVLCIRSDHVRDQLRQVVWETKIRRKDLRPFSRCIRCNSEIHRVDKFEAASRVPDHVWETHETFSACRTCGRIFWPGTHTRRAGRIIDALFGEVSPEEDETKTEEP
ncbi:MAG: hypothetical protein JRG88_11355 [Deltaproteobacteria bacterium]|nr:hypothetical protein [Deltaproteobacteria bacterium]